MRTRIDKEKGDWSQSTRRSRQNDSNVKEQTKSKRGVDVIESTKVLLWSTSVSDIGWRVDSQPTLGNDGFALVWQLNLENESVKLGREKRKNRSDKL